MIGRVLKNSKKNYKIKSFIHILIFNICILKSYIHELVFKKNKIKSYIRVLIFNIYILKSYICKKKLSFIVLNMSSTYEENFKKANFNIIDYIKNWPNNIDKTNVIKFVNLNNASMIYVPCFIKNEKEFISREHFYCTQCEKWKSINNSVRNIKRHAAIHDPEHFKEVNKTQKICTMTDNYEKLFIRNIIGFVLLEANSFSAIESKFLRNLCDQLPSKKKILIALKNLSLGTQKEIRNLLICSSCNCLTFDEWTDLKNRKFLGINVRSFIDREYHDFFLDFIQLTEEINDAPVLAKKIKASLKNYNLNVNDFLSCCTDNCSLMCKTAETLDLWRIPCVLHLLNLIFQEFIKGISQKISPILHIIHFTSNSQRYENFIEQKKQKGEAIRKIPNYVETRWTSFCESIIVLYETREEVRLFMGLKVLFDNIQMDNLEKLYRICTQYKNIVINYEADEFAASGCFLADISLIKEMFSELDSSDFKDGASCALKKIKELSKLHEYLWNNIGPIALLLNPQIEDYRELLTSEQIEAAKKCIISRMRKYPEAKQQQNISRQPSKYDKFKKKTSDVENVPLSPIEKLLENRNSSFDQKEYWLSKIGTDEQQLAFVALEILGLLVTSVLTERSFSKSRYVINNLRTNLSADHARDQMIIRCNKEIAIKALESINILEKDFDE